MNAFVLFIGVPYIAACIAFDWIRSGGRGLQPHDGKKAGSLDLTRDERKIWKQRYLGQMECNIKASEARR